MDRLIAPKPTLPTACRTDLDPYYLIGQFLVVKRIRDLKFSVSVEDHGHGLSFSKLDAAAPTNSGPFPRGVPVHRAPRRFELTGSLTFYPLS